jgi:hypothetical protein
MTFAATVLVTALLWQPSMSIDTALWGLEQSGSSLESFAAQVVLEKHRSFEDLTERRHGRLVLEGQGTERKLGCRIDSLVSGSREIETKARFVYDDGWFGDINLIDRSFIKRRVIEPGAKWDPLKLGEGPLPLPFGQPSDEVRARFDLSVATVPNTPFLSAVVKAESVTGLRLTPKAGTVIAEKAKYVEVYYDSLSLLPRLVRLVEPNDDSNTVVLIEPAANRQLSADDRALLVMPAADPALWTRVEVKEWETEGQADPK